MTEKRPGQHNLNTVDLPIDDLQEFHANARIGDEDFLAESLTELDQYRAIVVNKGTHTGRPYEVLAGNHTFRVAKALGWDSIACHVLDVDELKAAQIVDTDNAANDRARYDREKQRILLDEIIGRENIIGLDLREEEIDDLLDDGLLPSPIELPTDGKGTGASAIAESVQWGFIQWRTTRVRITAAEVQALDALHEQYVEEHSTDVGFGYHLARDGGADPSAAEGDQSVTLVKKA